MRRKNLSFLFLLLLGASVIIATGHLTSGVGRLISFSALLLVCYSLIRLFQNSDDLLKAILPHKNRKDIIPHTAVYRLSTLIFFAGLVLLISEILEFETVLRPGDFWRIYYSLGLIISLGLVFVLPLVSKDLYASGKRRFSIFWGMLLGMPFIILSFSSKVNRWMASENNYMETFSVLEKSTDKIRGTNRFEYYLTISTGEDATKDLLVEQSIHETALVGSSLTLELKEGYLGFKIIEEIKN